MIAREANILLLKINARDKFPRWTSAEDLAFAAREWAEDLSAVALDDALTAMREHYAASSERMTIADVIAGCPARDSSWAGNVTELRLARDTHALPPGGDDVA